MSGPRFINMSGGVTVQGREFHVDRVRSLDVQFKHVVSNSPVVATLVMDVEISRSSNDVPVRGLVNVGYDVKGGITQNVHLVCPTLSVPVAGEPNYVPECHWTRTIDHAEIKARHMSISGLTQQIFSIPGGFKAAESELVRESLEAHVKNQHGMELRTNTDPKLGNHQWILVRVEAVKNIELTARQAKLLAKVVGRITPGNAQTRMDLEAIMAALGITEADEVRRGL